MVQTVADAKSIEEVLIDSTAMKMKQVTATRDMTISQGGTGALFVYEENLPPKNLCLSDITFAFKSYVLSIFQSG